jgi:hypothetical protein
MKRKEEDFRKLMKQSWDKKSVQIMGVFAGIFFTFFEMWIFKMPFLFAVLFGIYSYAMMFFWDSLFTMIQNKRHNKKETSFK